MWERAQLGVWGSMNVVREPPPPRSAADIAKGASAAEPEWVRSPFGAVNPDALFHIELLSASRRGAGT